MSIPRLKQNWFKSGSRVWAGINSVALALILTLPLLASSQMQSGSYKIQFDSLNVGGVRSESSSFGLEDTTGEIATGDSSSETFKLHAGYQQMNASSISITAASDVNLPSINGLTGGDSDASASWTVTTDSPAGYELTIAAGTSPALASSEDELADYTPAGSDPDYTFSITSSEDAFAFSPEGNDIASRYKDNGSVCGTGSLDTTDACWDGFATTSKQIAVRASANHPSGTETTVKLRAASGNQNILVSGEYTATLTVTALSL